MDSNILDWCCWQITLRSNLMRIGRRIRFERSNEPTRTPQIIKETNEDRPYIPPSLVFKEKHFNLGKFHMHQSARILDIDVDNGTSYQYIHIRVCNKLVH